MNKFINEVFTYEYLKENIDVLYREQDYNITFTLPQVLVKIYNDIVRNYATQIYRNNRVARIMEDSLIKKFKIINVKCSNGIINHLGLEAFIDPYNTFLVDFIRNYASDFCEIVENQIKGNLGITKMTSNGKRISVMEYIYDVCDVSIEEFRIVCYRMALWLLQDELNFDYVEFIRKTRNRYIKNIKIDVEMFYTRNITNLYSHCIFIDYYIDFIENAMKTFDSKQQFDKLSNFATGFANCTDTRYHSVASYMKQALSGIKRGDVIPDAIIAEIDSKLKSIKANCDTTLDNAYNYDVCNDLMERLTTSNMLSNPGFYDKKLNLFYRG